MEFGILGPLAVWRGGQEVELGAAMERKLLAVMVLHADEAMSKERLVDALWGEQPPKQAVKGVQVRVSALRKKLGPGVVETHPLGYIVRLEKHTLDLKRFEQLLADGQRLLHESAPQRAGQVLREALALWRGEPLADFRYDAFAVNAIGQLEELRLIALEHRIEADLAVGRNAESVPELEALVREHPLRETLRGLLMRALYRSGRQADALAVMQETRATLLDELGLDPGQPLQQLEKLILNQDPSLDETAATPSATPVPAAPVEPAVDAVTRPPAEGSARAQRKVVTVLFADVAGSAELGETLDAEEVRGLLASYFERMKAAAERHGGVVEEFIGDAVMAVFGVPAVHEDDALRALRAAFEMRDAVVELGLEGRIGIESGEVVVGTPERLVTGRAVTTAARLQRAAEPGEVLFGEGTKQLAGDGVTAELLEPPELKGKSEPVSAWRLLSVSAEPPKRDSDSPFVGRGHELRALSEAWDRVVERERCELVTVVGAAGVGKSRLVTELLQRIDPTIANGRCLSYGAGITYWPVVEALTQLQPSLESVDPRIARPLAALLDGAGTASTDELAWAFRKFVEAVARERPLALIFDDIQWGEEALLDLIEHVALLSSSAPILLVCMARPELLDRRPGWRGVLRLEPLTPDEAEQLIHARLGDRAPDPAVSQRIVAAAEGNPLFVEEMAAMLQESGSAQAVVPATIQAVLATRLDQLDADERTVLEAAAVEGEVFHLGALEALTGEPRLTAHLTALVRKEFVGPDRSVLEGEEAFRFRHLLLRDAAYHAIPKAARSLLHERYANWLEQRSEPLDAFVGFHLEKSYRYRLELGPSDEEVAAIGERGARRLASAGHRASDRGDGLAAANLLGRAISLLPPDGREWVGLVPDLAECLLEGGNIREAQAAVERAIEAAERNGDERLGVLLRVQRAWLAMDTDPTYDPELALREAEHAIDVLEPVGDDLGLARSWLLVFRVHWIQGQLAAVRSATERGLFHAERAGSVRYQAEHRIARTASIHFGLAPMAEAEASLDGNLAWAREAGSLGLEAVVLTKLGAVHAARGDRATAAELVASGIAILSELGARLNAAGVVGNHIWLLTDDPVEAETRLRESYEMVTEAGAQVFRSTVASKLAEALWRQGRDAEAEELLAVATAAAAEDDILTQVAVRAVHAKILARRGLATEAEAAAREAVALAAEQEYVDLRGDSLLALGEVLRLAGRTDEAAAATRQALAIWETKGNLTFAARARRSLEELEAAPPAGVRM